MSKTFGIGTLKPYFQFSAEEGWCDLTGGKRSPIYQALPAFVFDSIFEGTGHVVVVVSLLLGGIENRVDKLANLGILVASLVISVKKMQGMYKQGNVWSITCKGCQAVFLRRCGILHLLYRENLFQTFCTLICSLLCLFSVAGKYRLGTVCT